ncbi:putative DNA repair protein [Polaribacter irgensii 23-P]|uniref:Putative DNA repair protein n=1 Tax=Polaribacter irgensii 23-P TaxID=313594 RepID=A4BXR1_9FLAO|nr:JAB domain-containing protein [Polaribacter irgensii]EAR13752.1 putative DNA repair protein [Polaribacter irgensii 23-P]
MLESNISEVKISYSNKTLKKFRIKINKSSDAFKSFTQSWDMDLIELQEEFKILLLNNANEVLGIHALSKGSTRGTVVDLKLLFVIALKSNATGIIIAHNHPSSNLKPSRSDLELTKRIKKSGELLDIKLLDHLIITKDEFYSLSDNDCY